MKKTIKARGIDAIIGDCERTHAKATRFGAELSYLLWDYNMRLVDYYEAIREAQPKRHGAVLLQLRPCGKKCLGCPHPEWVKWVNRNAENPEKTPTWFAATLERPTASARAKHIPEHARALIREAQEFIKQRDSLVSAIRHIRHVVAGHKQANPDLGHLPEGRADGSNGG